MKTPAGIPLRASPPISVIYATEIGAYIIFRFSHFALALLEYFLARFIWPRKISMRSIFYTPWPPALTYRLY